MLRQCQSSANTVLDSVKYTSKTAIICSVGTAFKQCSDSVRMMYIQCSDSVRMMYIQCSAVLRCCVYSARTVFQQHNNGSPLKRYGLLKQSADVFLM